MSAEEEYLDQLLAQALNPEKNKTEAGKKADPAGEETTNGAAVVSDAVVVSDEVADAGAVVVEDTAGAADVVAVVDAAVAEEIATTDDVMAADDDSEALSGDFNMPKSSDVPELDLNSQGAKDFNLDGISADELASEIEAFEEDADDSVLPTGEGIGYDIPEDIADADEAVAEATGDDASEETELPGVGDTLEIPGLVRNDVLGAVDSFRGEDMSETAESVDESDMAVGAQQVGSDEAAESDENVSDGDLSEIIEPDGGDTASVTSDMSAEDIQEGSSNLPEDTESVTDTDITENVDELNDTTDSAESADEGGMSADDSDGEAIDDALNEILDEIPEENQKEIGSADPESELAVGETEDEAPIDDANDINDINAVDDLLSDNGGAGLIDDGAISDFSEEIEAEGEADDLLSLLKNDGAGDDDIQSDLSGLADMDPDDLEARIAAAEAGVPGESLPSTDGDADILDMLSDMDVLDGDLGDIKDVLEKSDNNEALNADLLKEPDVGPDSFDDDSDEDESDGGKKSKKKKKKKEKKKKEKGEKGSFFASLFGKKKKNKDSEEEAGAEGETTAEAASAVPEADVSSSADMDLLDDMSDIAGDPQEGAASDSENSDNEGADDGSDKKNKKKGEKKKGLIAALLEAVFYEEEDEASPEESATKLSDENKQILNELDAEGEEKGKKKKKKKEKKPKEKKPKKPKEKKPKKEKPAGEEEKGPKIPKKYIIRSAAFAASVLAAAIVLAVFLPKANVMKSARTAYYDHDYKEAFYSMYGKKLNESDQLIYDRSKTIILMERKYESYGQYKAMGMSDKALDALFQGLKRYEALKTDAETLGVKGDIDSTRESILLALQNDYGVSEEQAMEIIEYGKTDYTGAVNAILLGEPYVKMQDAVNAMYGLGGSGNVEPEMPEEGGASDPGLPDMLPEEEQYILENGTDPNAANDAESSLEDATDDSAEENAEESAPEENVPEDNHAEEQNPSKIIVETDDNVQVQIESTQF